MVAARWSRPAGINFIVDVTLTRDFPGLPQLLAWVMPAPKK